MTEFTGANPGIDRNSGGSPTAAAASVAVDAGLDGSSTTYPVEFTGSGSEYFKIWIVNVFLTVITLYIYSAWAKVRTKRYFYGNTVIDGSSFEYHAKGKQIFLGRMIATLLFIAVVVLSSLNPVLSIVLPALIFLVIPWVVWRSMKFNARMSSFRNIRFSFRKKVGRLYAILVGIPLIPFIVAIALIGGFMALSGGGASELFSAGAGGSLPGYLVSAIAFIPFVLLYLTVPWIHKLLVSYSMNGHHFGTSSFKGEFSTGRSYLIYFYTFLVGLLIFAILAALGALVAYFFKDQLGSLNLNPGASAVGASNMAPSAPQFLILLIIPLYMAIIFLLTAFFMARMRSYRYDPTTLADNVSFVSNVRTFPLWKLMFTNLLLIIFTLGLAYPWTKVRSARFFAANTHVVSKVPLGSFIAEEQKNVAALGEELGEAFDIDMDIAI